MCKRLLSTPYAYAFVNDPIQAARVSIRSDPTSETVANLIVAAGRK